MTTRKDKEPRPSTLTEDDIKTEKALERRSVLSMIGGGVVGAAVLAAPESANAVDRDRTRQGDPASDSDSGRNADRAADSDTSTTGDPKGGRRRRRRRRQSDTADSDPGDSADSD
jgi:hypothetical protein